MEIELDAFTAISLVASNVNTNGDLSGLVHDCRELLPKLPQVKLSTASGTQNFAPMPYISRLGSTSADVFSIL